MAGWIARFELHISQSSGMMPCKRPSKECYQSGIEGALGVRRFTTSK